MRRSTTLATLTPLAIVFASGIFVSRAAGQSSATSAPASAAARPSPTTRTATGPATKAPALVQSGAAKASATPSRSRFYPARFSKRAALYYGLYWGVDDLRVKYAESGEMIRFSYRVVDEDKAAPLNDKKVEPSLIDPQAKVKLVVPSLEQVGMLRQSSKAETGKVYWMAFSNKGRLVKPGDHVNVVIGNFRANGLVVE